MFADDDKNQNDDDKKISSPLFPEDDDLLLNQKVMHTQFSRRKEKKSQVNKPQDD